MVDPVEQALESAQDLYGPGRWELLDRQDRAAAIYHKLCRIDSGCQRNGTPNDANLPLCPAPPSFRVRRHCPFGGDGTD